MNRFRELLSRKKSFIPYFLLGYPDLKTSVELIKLAIDEGCDALEIGLPFSDPVADGPTIQAAHMQALKANLVFQDYIDALKIVRDYSDIPLGVMCYYNILFRQGESVYASLKAAGVDALLVVDLPLEESFHYAALCLQHDLGLIYLIAPNTPLARAQLLLEHSTAFAYVVSRHGTTGVTQTLAHDLKARIQALKKISDTPLVVGFGISQRDHVQAVYEAGGQGVIIASRLVEIISQHVNAPSELKQALKLFLRSMVC